ncbi:hypothetical protein RHGRI_037366 [Rhododendron griersonianum]|uniref:MORF/ORRM1/DAG-like MORF domain-containing protein n=1 Tax=Rhododendron griersonianum TaxID=479676 RepID=A0AAV6HV60_9ERIC|nr:hypothetical protein RHGRI_037366 [Rhododendron griersonianum]
MATLNLSLLPKTLKTPLSTSTLPLAAAPFRSATTVHLNPTTPRGSLVLLRASVDGNRTAKQRSSGSNDPGDTIMLPGCDFNHWLIIMEFPQDPAPTRDQMIQTYLETLATVVGSMEEAKKNMYAFSTTTYTGFQCTVSEETSEKFKGLPGVLWVLPDSYIDVKNEDYGGGDKYINGEIIPSTYPTYQPNQPKNRSKYESKKFVRKRDGSAAN